VTAAIRQCIGEGIMAEYLKEKGSEIESMRAPVRLLVQTRCESETVRGSRPPLPSSLG
jgi:hypothetical protein